MNGREKFKETFVATSCIEKYYVKQNIHISCSPTEEWGRTNRESDGVSLPKGYFSAAQGLLSFMAVFLIQL